MKQDIRSLAAALAVSLATSVAAGDIVIAQVAPFTGNLAPTGRDINIGARLYFDEVNAQGGVNGNKIRFVAYDDGYKTEQTVKLVRESIQRDRPIALMGLVGTGNVEAIVKQKVLAENGLPVVGVRTGATTVRSDPYIFHLRASYADETSKIIDHLATLTYSRIAVLYQADSFGEEGLAGVNAAMKRHNLKLVTAAPYEKNTTNVEAAVKAIIAAAPQAVVMVSNTAASAEFVKQMRGAGNYAALYAVSVTDGNQLMDKIGEKYARGLAVAQVMPNPALSSVRLVKELSRLVEQSGNKEARVTFTSVEGYLMAKVLVEGLKRAGRTPTRESLARGLESLTGWDSGGLTVKFGSGVRDGVSYVDLTMVGRGGKLYQ